VGDVIKVTLGVLENEILGVLVGVADGVGGRSCGNPSPLLYNIDTSSGVNAFFHKHNSSITPLKAWLVPL